MYPPPLPREAPEKLAVHFIDFYCKDISKPNGPLSLPPARSAGKILLSYMFTFSFFLLKCFRPALLGYIFFPITACCFSPVLTIHIFTSAKFIFLLLTSYIFRSVLVAYIISTGGGGDISCTGDKNISCQYWVENTGCLYWRDISCTGVII